MRIFPCGARVEFRGSQRVASKVQEDIRERVRGYEEAEDRKLRARLRELDAEWDTERAFEAGAAALTIAGSALGALCSRKWLMLSAAAGFLLLERALRGWCPMQPVLRRCGLRSESEIETEKDTIRAILGKRTAQEQADARSF
jgi:hypothetical protein